MLGQELVRASASHPRRHRFIELLVLRVHRAVRELVDQQVGEVAGDVVQDRRGKGIRDRQRRVVGGGGHDRRVVAFPLPRGRLLVGPFLLEVALVGIAEDGLGPKTVLRARVHEPAHRAVDGRPRPVIARGGQRQALDREAADVERELELLAAAGRGGRVLDRLFDRALMPQQVRVAGGGAVAVKRSAAGGEQQERESPYGSTHFPCFLINSTSASSAFANVMPFCTHSLPTYRLIASGAPPT